MSDKKDSYNIDVFVGNQSLTIVVPEGEAKEQASLEESYRIAAENIKNEIEELKKNMENCDPQMILPICYLETVRELQIAKRKLEKKNQEATEKLKQLEENLDDVL